MWPFWTCHSLLEKPVKILKPVYIFCFFIRFVHVKFYPCSWRQCPLSQAKRAEPWLLLKCLMKVVNSVGQPLPSVSLSLTHKCWGIFCTFYDKYFLLLLLLPNNMHLFSPLHNIFWILSITKCILNSGFHNHLFFWSRSCFSPDPVLVVA